MKERMQNELDWQVRETRKVKTLVDGSRQAANEAIERAADLEKATNEMVARAQEEMADCMSSAAKECERMLMMLTAEQEDHAVTKQLLADERHARGLEALEMERMRIAAAEGRAVLRAAETAKERAEERMEAAQAELTESEREHAEHFALAMEEVMARLEAELADLRLLQRQALEFQDNDGRRARDSNPSTRPQHAHARTHGW
jgi:hypothetical protein